MDADYRSSLVRRLRAVHSLYGEACRTMTLEQVNAVSHPATLPIAFSLVHQALIEDGSLIFLGGPAPQFNDEWASRIGLGVNDHGKERSVEEMMRQRIGDYDAFCEFQQLVFRASETYVASIEPESFMDVIVAAPYGETLARTFSALVGGERRHHPQRRPGVLGIPTRPSPYGRDRARSLPRRPHRHDVLKGTAVALVDGTTTDRFHDLRERLEASVSSGDDLGVSLAVIHHGEFVCDLWGGYTDPERTTPWSRDTIVNVWSTTKTMVFLVMLMLSDRGQLDFDEDVATYWPDFAEEGKGDIKVHHLMNHTAGLSGFSPSMVLEDLADWDRCTTDLAHVAPWWSDRAQSGYHAVTQGYLLGEVVRRITGRPSASTLRPRSQASSARTSISDCPSPKSRG